MDQSPLAFRQAEAHLEAFDHYGDCVLNQWV
jgi:hypothetical protein